MDNSCFTSRIPVSRVSQTKTVKDLIQLATNVFMKWWWLQDLIYWNEIVWCMLLETLVPLLQNRVTGEIERNIWHLKLTSLENIDYHNWKLLTWILLLLQILLAIKRHLFKLYDINSVHSFLISTQTLKQKISCTAVHLRRYNEKLTRYRQNYQFHTNQKKLIANSAQVVIVLLENLQWKNWRWWWRLVVGDRGGGRRSK